MKLIVCILLPLIVALSNVECARIKKRVKTAQFLDDENQVTNEVRVSFDEKFIVGAPRTIDINDNLANKLLNQHLKRLVTGDRREFIIHSIEEITCQVVAGYLFKIKGEYEVEGTTKFCTINILSQPWTTTEDEQVIISAKCEDGSCYVTESYTCSPDSLYGMHKSRSQRLFLFA